MRFKLMLTLAALALAGAVRAQEPRQDEQQVIDDFVNTRGFVFVEQAAKKSAAKPAPKGGGAAQNRPRRKPVKGSGAQAGKAPVAEAAAAKKKTPAGVEENVEAAPGDGSAGEAAGGVSAGEAAADVSTAGAAAPKAGEAERPIALGYTLYRRDAGRLVVADESHVFRQNERLRIFLETNTDGYVYVFNTTDGASPVMLYPHANVARGGNRIAAHTRDFVPAGSDFEFDANPGTERVHVVVSRRPLAGVPAGEELVRLCGGEVEGCYWQPDAAEWARVEAAIREGGRVREGRSAQLARLQPAAPDTLARGVRIKKEEPPPAVVRVNDSPAADLLLTTITLIHK
ncbi:MAG TPA: DUF4384 domain-containing protein [Pyrinomonadaceae bacterium]|nr:DUF4384 domain-containing protein [Pyrinomonadaceae bacterium]